MGQTCGCCSNDTQSSYIDMDTEIKHQDWANACTNMALAGIRGLHAENPDLIDEPVDNEGHKAIHIAIINKNDKMLLYLLKNGVDINARGGKQRNTALHEAVLLTDKKTIRYLFQHGIDDTITNKNGKRAIDLCPSSFRREFLREKASKTPNNAGGRGLNRMATNNEFSLYGTTETADIQRNVRQMNQEYDYYRRKQREIEEREMVQTIFGDETGCDVDEIAMTLQKFQDKGKLWKKWAKKESLTKQTEIYKILFGLTFLTLKKKDPRTKRPPSQPIKKLTTRLCKKLPKKHRKTVLTKEYFVESCHDLMYQVHDEMVKEESEIN